MQDVFQARGRMFSTIATPRQAGVQYKAYVQEQAQKHKVAQAAAAGAAGAAAVAVEVADANTGGSYKKNPQEKNPWAFPLPLEAVNPLRPPSAECQFAVRIYRPSPPPDTGVPAAPAPESAKAYAGFTLSRAAVYESLGVQKFKKQAHEHGLSLWTAEHYKEKEGELLGLDPQDAQRGALARAIETQDALRARHHTSALIRACLAQAPPDPASSNVLDAVEAALKGAHAAFFLWQHPERILGLQERKRRRKRLINRTVDDVLRFARAAQRVPAEPPPPPPPDGAPPKPPLVRVPVVVIGDRAVSGESHGPFPMKACVRLLAKEAAVVVASEFRTTKLCGFCGCAIEHPRKMNGRVDHGTVYCPDPTCFSGGRFLNRDVAASSNIVERFTTEFYFGGQLGCFDRAAAVAKDAPRLSLFGTLTPCPAAGGTVVRWYATRGTRRVWWFGGWGWGGGLLTHDASR